MHKTKGMGKFRVRFAPSPTGPLHIGGVRTALFNYLLAKKNNGQFILRIEDTDQKRFVPGSIEYIQEALEWAGIVPDEGFGYGGDYGPYKQSERKDLYEQCVEQLLEEGKAYYAFDTPEELEAMRQQFQQEGKTFQYDASTRSLMKNSLTLSENEVTKLLEQGQPYVIRFKIPENRTVKMQDLIRGEVEVNTNTLDDKVLVKSDGLPTYHLANVVDDHLMEITHVIRGEEWLPSLALHHLLYEAFGWQPPKFAHLPLILKPTGKGKLSKRDGIKGGFPVFPLEWTDPQTDEKLKGFREEGYLPEAFINMLALLGWNPGTDREIFTMNELIKAFDLSGVNKSGARFDPEKAKWFQQQHLQLKSEEELLELVLPVIRKQLGFHTDGKAIRDYTLKVLKLVKERLVFPADFWTWASFFYQAPEEYNPKVLKKHKKPQTKEILEKVVKFLQGIEDWKAPFIKEQLSGFIEENQFSFGKVLQPLRIALTGDLKGPDLFEMMELIGKDETLKRIEKALKVWFEE